MLSVFAYENYRTFLRDHFREKKRAHRSYTYRKFAEEANLASPTHYKLVVDGKRNLSHKSVRKFVKGLRLNAREASYFESLVFYKQARSTEEKAEWLRKILEMKSHLLQRSLSGSQQAALYENWYHVWVYECLSMDGARARTDWISLSSQNQGE